MLHRDTIACIVAAAPIYERLYPRPHSPTWTPPISSPVDIMNTFVFQTLLEASYSH